MTFYAFGFNHETAPVALREAFALHSEAKRVLYRALVLSDDAEVMLLSTCNRTEVYLYGSMADVATVKQALSAHTGQAWPEEHTFLLESETAIRHLLHVTAGLHSMVLGDAQILGQVKEAYRLAVEEEHVGTVLHRLIHTAFRAAKTVINETDLTSGTASVSAAAIAAARRYLEVTSTIDLAGSRVLVIGAGQMAQLALEALALVGPAHLVLTNRSPARAQTLADRFGATVIPWALRYDAVREADLVFVASGASEPILRADAMPEPHAGQATLLIDIAVPRNVDPAIDTMPGYTVIDLDGLNTDLVRTEQRRRAAVPAAQAICDEALGEYVTWFFHQQALQPAIHAIRDTFEQIRRQEIERHHGRFSDLDREELDRLTRSIMQKLLAVPVVRLKNVNPESIDFVQGIKLLHALFTRPECEDASAAGATEDVPGPEEVMLRPSLPADCPFDPGEAVANPEEALRAALRTQDDGPGA